MTTKSVNTDAARYRALRREEVMVSMTHDGNTGSTPWLEGDELDKCADSLLAATPLEPFIEQAQPEAITDAVMQVYHRTPVGDALDYGDIYDAVKAVLAAPVAAQAQPSEKESIPYPFLPDGLIVAARHDKLSGTVYRAEHRDEENRLVIGGGWQPTRQAATAEAWAIKCEIMTAQQPVSGADGLTDAAIEMLAKQYDCHNAPGFKGFARAVAALAQQDADNVQGYDREAEVKAFEEAWVSGTQDLGEDYLAAKKAWLLKAQQDDDGHCRSCQGDFCTAGAECVAMEDTQAPRVVQLTHSKHGTMQINTSILREVANREAGEGTFIDAAGTVWSRPTAYAYAMVCKARDKWQAKAEEARDSALGEAAQALAYRRNLLISQNIVNDIQEGVALYDICIDAVLSLQQNATSTSPDKPGQAQASHPNG